MKVIVPRPMTLISSNVPEETAYPVWDSAATYNKDDIVLVENLDPNGITKMFKSLADSNSGYYPPDNPDKWGDLGATNKWKCLDIYVSSQTVYANEIDITLQASRVNYISLFEVEANDLLIEILDPDTPEVLYSQTYSLRLDEGSSWYDYFFGDFIFRRSFVAPVPISASTLNYRIKLTSGGDAKLGMVVLGLSKRLGLSLWSPRVGIRDFSRKETDEELGFTYLKKGPRAKRMEFDIQVESIYVDQVQRTLADLRATPCVWVANNEYENEELSTNYESLIVYGFYKDFDIILQGPIVSNCSLTIEGLI